MVAVLLSVTVCAELLLWVAPLTRQKPDSPGGVAARWLWVCTWLSGKHAMATAKQALCQVRPLVLGTLCDTSRLPLALVSVKLLLQ